MHINSVIQQAVITISASLVVRSGWILTTFFNFIYLYTVWSSSNKYCIHQCICDYIELCTVIHYLLYTYCVEQADTRRWAILRQSWAAVLVVVHTLFVQTTSYHSNLSDHIIANDRWLLTAPNTQMINKLITKEIRRAMATNGGNTSSKYQSTNQLNRHNLLDSILLYLIPSRTSVSLCLEIARD